MASKIEEKIKLNIMQDILNLGYELEYIEYIKEGSNKVLRVVIDKQDSSISIDDCEKVSRTIDEKVEQVMGTETYVIEVSSPGVERKLKNEFLYQKYVGRHIHINLYKSIAEGKSLEGKLISFNTEKKSIVIRLDGKIDETEISLKDIASGYTTYDFSMALSNNNDKEESLGE